MYSQNLVFNGLGTLTTVLPETAPGFIKGKITLPTISQGIATPSLLVCTISQNGSTIYTGPAGAEGFYTTYSGVLGDSIAIVVTSASTSDAPLNVVKMSVSLGSGQ